MNSSLTKMGNDDIACSLLKSGRDGCMARFDRSLYQLSLIEGDDIERIDLGFSGSRVLERLLQTPGEVVSREELLRHAWQDRVVGQGSLNQQIYTLRQVLCDSAGQIIQTLPRRGYLFNPNYLIHAQETQATTRSASIEQDTPMPAQPEATVTTQVRRSPWLMPSVLGTTLVVLLAVATLAYRFIYTPTGSLTHNQTIGHLEVLYVEKSQQMLERAIQETRMLVASVAQLSSHPSRLIVSMSPGFYELRCLRNDGRINWLKIHRSQVNAISNETLQGCLR
jgi:DNA-binding winged helix-turn-helix (wHTH) protein